MNEEANTIKGSNLGFIIGILAVVAVVMFVYKSSFVQDRISKESDTTPSSEVDTSTFEIIDEPEITLLDEDVVLDEISEEIVVEEIDTHDPVDTAIGDINPMLLSILLVGGAGFSFITSKRLS